MPSTRTAQGYLTPFEVIEGRPPFLKWLQIWGCKTYTLKPEDDRRKDFDDEAYSVFLVGFSEEKLGYDVYVPDLDTVVTTVHVCGTQRGGSQSHC